MDARPPAGRKGPTGADATAECTHRNGEAGNPREALQPCGLLRRVLAMTYDGIAVLALLFLAAAIALPVTGGRSVALRDPIYTLYLLIPWAAYLGWCWTHGGMTLGMRAWKVRLVAADGPAIGWGRALARFALSWISAAPLGLGFAWSLFDRDRLAWHDRWTRTRLVRSTPTGAGS